MNNLADLSILWANISKVVDSNPSYLNAPSPPFILRYAIYPLYAGYNDSNLSLPALIVNLTGKY